MQAERSARAGRVESHQCDLIFVAEVNNILMMTPVKAPQYPGKKCVD